MAREMKRTGRAWECPVCHFVLPEAEVEHSEVICHRNQTCRQKHVKMIVREVVSAQ